MQNANSLASSNHSSLICVQGPSLQEEVIDLNSENSVLPLCGCCKAIMARLHRLAAFFIPEHGFEVLPTTPPSEIPTSPLSDGPHNYSDYEDRVGADEPQPRADMQSSATCEKRVQSTDTPISKNLLQNTKLNSVSNKPEQGLYERDISLSDSAAVKDLSSLRNFIASLKNSLPFRLEVFDAIEVRRVGRLHLRRTRGESASRLNPTLRTIASDEEDFLLGMLGTGARRHSSLGRAVSVPSFTQSKTKSVSPAVDFDSCQISDIREGDRDVSTRATSLDISTTASVALEEQQACISITGPVRPNAPENCDALLAAEDMFVDIYPQFGCAVSAIVLRGCDFCPLFDASQINSSEEGDSGDMRTSLHRTLVFLNTLFLAFSAPSNASLTENGVASERLTHVAFYRCSLPPSMFCGAFRLPVTGVLQSLAFLQCPFSDAHVAAIVSYARQPGVDKLFSNLRSLYITAGSLTSGGVRLLLRFFDEEVDEPLLEELVLPSESLVEAVGTHALRLRLPKLVIRTTQRLR